MSTATAVKERPIIFSSEMVRAILEGRKTQTRRVVIHQGRPLADFAFYEVDGDEIRTESGRKKACPYGRVGDLLWVREKWMPIDPSFRDSTTAVNKRDDKGRHHRIVYAASCGAHADWNNPLFMPRWASRITLEITDVRVQRLQEISEEDAIAEGVAVVSRWHRFHPDAFKSSPEKHWQPTAKDAFKELWNSIHGDGAWVLNPWLWCISFRVAPTAAKEQNTPPAAAELVSGVGERGGGGEKAK